MRRAASRADCTAGNNSAIKTAMIAMTTKSSMSVKPGRVRLMRVTSPMTRNEGNRCAQDVPERVGYGFWECRQAGWLRGRGLGLTAERLSVVDEAAPSGAARADPARRLGGAAGPSYRAQT